jgi:hypothetical protein
MNRRESLALWGSGTIAWKGAGGLRDCLARPAADPLAHMLGDEPLPRNDIEVRSVCTLSSMRDVQVRHDATPHSALISGGVSCKNAISTEKETKLGKDCLADAFCWRGGGYNRTRRITRMQPPHAEKFTR